MNEKIKAHLLAHCEKEGYEDVSDEGFVEIITEAEEVFSEVVGHHRWYDDTWNVVEIDGMYIGYPGYHTTGDSHYSDMGLEITVDDFVICQKVEKVIEVFEPIKE